MAATAVDMVATALPAAMGADMAHPWADMVDMADINVSEMSTALLLWTQTWKHGCRLGNIQYCTVDADLETRKQTLKRGCRHGITDADLETRNKYGFEKECLLLLRRTNNTKFLLFLFANNNDVK
jgi:hypothetical protein